MRELEAVNLFHDYKPRGSREKAIAVIDADGNYFPSMTAAAAAHGVTQPTVMNWLRSGKWRRA